MSITELIEQLDKLYTNRDKWYANFGIKDREVCCSSSCTIVLPIKREQNFIVGRNFIKTAWTIESVEYGEYVKIPILRYDELGLTCTQGTDTTIFVPWDNVRSIVTRK